MDDRSRNNGSPRRGIIIRRIFRRIVWGLRYFAVNYCSCRHLVSFFLLICSLALLRMGCNNRESALSNNDLRRDSADSLTNLADFEGGTLVRKRNSNNADVLARLLDGDTENLLWDSIDLTTMMDILDDGSPRECVHGEAGGAASKCLQCAAERFKEICEQQARELESYSRLYTIHPVPNERTCLLSGESKGACSPINSENRQLRRNASVGNSGSGATGISKPGAVKKGNARLAGTWFDVVASPDSFDGLYVNEVNIRGLDNDMGTYGDFPNLDDLEFEINAPYLEVIERAANPPPVNPGLHAILSKSHRMPRYPGRVPEEPVQTYHEVLSRIRSLINLPYQNQCTNSSAKHSQQIPPYTQYNSERPAVGAGALQYEGERRAQVTVAIQCKGERPAAVAGAIQKKSERPAAVEGAIQYEREHLVAGAGAMPHESERPDAGTGAIQHERVRLVAGAGAIQYERECLVSGAGVIQYERERPAQRTGAVPKNRNAIRPAMQQEAPGKEQGHEGSPSRATGAIPKNWDLIRKLQRGAESGGQCRPREVHSNLSLSASHSRYTDTVIANPYAGAFPTNLDVIQPRNNRQSWTSELNYWSFEMNRFSRITDHQTAAASHGRTRHYTSNIRATGDLNPRLILVTNEASNNDDDDDDVVTVIEYSGEGVDTDDDTLVGDTDTVDNDNESVIAGISEIFYSDDENETFV